MSFGATLRFGADDEALRARIRTWLVEHPARIPPHDYAQQVSALCAWQAELCRAGFVGLSWPAALGGHDLGMSAEAVLAEELANTDAPELINRLAIYTWGPTLMLYGDDEQKRRYLPRMLDASELWCQGFSEPGAGSDLAAVATSAVDDGDAFRVTGQKVWTTRALWSRWCALLVRTSREASRHSGLSVLILDMRAPGVSVRPLLEITHEPRFSEVFFDSVGVPKESVIGRIGDGWKVAMSAMSFERGLFVLERQIRLRKRLDDLARELDARGRADDSAAILGRLLAATEVLRARVYSTLAAQAAGTLEPGATSVDKLLLANVHQDLFGTAFDLLGGEAWERSEWSDDVLESRGVSIYSGTSQIQRNVIATQLLGLPRPS